jgi:hypothetical protein
MRVVTKILGPKLALRYGSSSASEVCKVAWTMADLFTGGLRTPSKFANADNARWRLCAANDTQLTGIDRQPPEAMR